ncbi:MAG: hypothetical protein WB523_10155 [Candidatus Sulfotelmatobacter sp.]
MGSDATDEKAIGLFVEGRGTSEESREKGIERRHGNETASVFKDKFGGEIGVSSLDAGAGFVDGKFAENIVVVQTPTGAVLLGADGAERFEKFEEADVVAALVLDDRQGIVGGGGIDREMFFGSGAGERECEEQGDGEGEQ